MAVADVLISIGVFVAIYSILAFGMNIKYGHTGLLDFGHVGFYLIGAYTASLFVLPPDNPMDFTTYVVGLGEVSLVGNWLTGLVAATVLAGVIGGIVALPTITLREDYLAITLLGISVIFQRVVQSEKWLANGPDALRGYSPPAKALFPLDTGSLAGAALFGLIVFVIWAAATGLLEQTMARRTPPSSGRLLMVPTFGLSALGRRLPALGAGGGLAVGAGALAGIGTTLLALAGGMVLTVGAIVSIYTWVVAAIAIRSRYADIERRTIAAGVATGTGLLVALLPLPLAESLAPKIGLTLAGLVVLVGGYARAVRTREWVGAAKLSILGVGALWFFLIWYLVLPVVGPVQQRGLAAAGRVILENVVWLLKFGGDEGLRYSVGLVGGVTLNVDYTRFILTTFLLCVGLLYYVLEVAVTSPFGRVLRAVRNDETVVRSLGKDPFVYKIQSMVIGSALAGLAGGLWAIWAQGLVFTMFAPRVTFLVLLVMFIGGVGNNKGMIAGAAVYWAFQEGTTQLAGYFPPEVRVNILSFRLVVIGLLFLVVLYYLPEGLFPRSEPGREDQAG